MVRVRVSNSGQRRGTEVVQLYVRDPVASLSRPLRQLKGFRRVALDPGASTIVEFTLVPADLAFWHGGAMQPEDGMFEVTVGGDSRATRSARFELVTGTPN